MADIIQALVSILLFLDSLIYSLINWVYQIILILCQVDILNNTFEVQGLINRLYVIIGVVVLFVVAYSLLRSMVNPDDAIKGKKSPVTIIRDVLISIVAIALVPTIFSVASRFQNAILLENTIGKIILGDTINAGDATYDSDETVRNGGMEIASNVLRAFLHPRYDLCNLEGSEYDCSNVEVNTMGVGIPFIFSIPVVSDNYDDIWQEIYDSGNFLNITIFSYSIAHDGNITYYYLISTLVGAFVLLVLLSYCIDIAIRTIKLAVYQLIAPLPILARIAPGEQGSKIFSNWLKATISTYLEVFIRLAILFFAVLMVKLVVQNLPTLLIGGGFISGNAGFTVYLFAQLFLIVGIILFVKQAPGLIKEITGLDGGKYNVFGSAFKTAAMLGGGVTTAVRNWNDRTDAEGKEKSTFDRFRSAAAGLGSGAFRSTFHRDDVKGFKDVKQNAHNAAEEAIKKRIQRENMKQDRKNYFQNINDERAKKGEEPIKSTGLGAWTKYKAYTASERASEWSGKGKYNEVTIGRTKDYADSVDANFSALENTWKKTQAFVDAKAETDNLKHDLELFKERYQTELKKIYETNGIDEKTATESELNTASELANQELTRKYGTSYADVNEKYTRAKNRQEGIKRAEQFKKAEAIGFAARAIQLANAQYTDVSVDMGEVLKRYLSENPDKDRDELTAKFNESIKLYGNLRDENVLKRFQEDIKNGTELSQIYIDVLDKMNAEARYNKSQAAAIEQERKGTFGKPPQGGGGAK